MAQTQCGFEDHGQVGEQLLAERGPTLLVDIGFELDGQLAADPPDLAMKGLQALVDTGATECCIDASLALSLNLPVVNQRPMGGIGGQHNCNIHLATMWVPSLGFSILGHFAGVDLKGAGQPHQAIIGRNVLRLFTMVYVGSSGQVTLSDEHNGSLLLEKK